MITGNDNNSSTEAVADAFMDDRDNMGGFDEIGDLLTVNNPKANDDQIGSNPLNDAFVQEENQIPPEYANDPDLWYAIQASLKVRFMSEHVFIC